MYERLWKYPQNCNRVCLVPHLNSSEWMGIRVTHIQSLRLGYMQGTYISCLDSYYMSKYTTSVRPYWFYSCPELSPCKTYSDPDIQNHQFEFGGITCLLNSSVANIPWNI